MDITSYSTFIQYGEPRTASTVQYVTLCIIVNMIFGRGPVCRFATPQMLHVPGATHMVLKSHGYLHPDWKKENVLWFITYNNNTSLNDTVDQITEEQWTSRYHYTYSKKFRQILKNLNLQYKTVAFVQEFSFFKRIGGSLPMAAALVHRLQFSDKQLSEIYGFLKYWEIHRKCCGSQSSKSWRKALHDDGGRTIIPIRDTFSSPDCHVYNLRMVEQMVINSTVCRTYLDIMPHPPPHISPKSFMMHKWIDQTALSNTICPYNGLCKQEFDLMKKGYDFNGMVYDRTKPLKY